MRTFFVIFEHFQKLCHPKSKAYKLVALGIMGFQNHKNSYYCSIYMTIICILILNMIVKSGDLQPQSKIINENNIINNLASTKI